MAFSLRNVALLLLLNAATAWAGPLPYRSAIKMTSATHGYALRSSEGNHGLPDVVLETKDSGAHWARLPGKAGQMAALLPDGTPAWFGAPSEICPGGLDTVDDEHRPLWSFVDSSHAWVASCGESRDHRELRSIFRTVDAGVTWAVVSATSLTDDAGSLPAIGKKSGMYFHDATRGWIFGSDEEGTTDLFATLDAGKTWKRQELFAPKNAWVGFRTQPDTLHAFGAHDVLLSMDIQFNTEDPTPTLYLSNDVGAHWKQIGPAPGPHLSFSDLNHGFSAAGDRLWSTKDGGRHWVRVSVGLGKVDEMQFISADTGWIWSCGATFDARCQLITTRDGGKRWFVQDPQEAEEGTSEQP